MLNIHSGWSKSGCFANSSISGQVKTKIVLSPRLAYVISSDDNALTGVYLDWKDQSKQLNLMPTGVRLNEFSVKAYNKSDSVEKKLADLELVVVKAGMVSRLLYRAGELVSNEHIETAIGSGRGSSYACTIGDSLIVASDTGMSILTGNKELLPIQPAVTGRKDELKVTFMECLESGSIIVGRGDGDGISFIPVSSDVQASRTRR